MAVYSRIALVIFCFFIYQPAQAETNWKRGPVELDNQYFLAVNNLSLTPASPEVATANTHQLDAQLSWTNSIGQDDTVLFDAESRIFKLRYKYSLSNSSEVGLALPFVWRGGGVLDSFIDEWHKFFGFPRGDRNEVEHNEFNLIGRRDDGIIFSDNNQGFGIGDLSLSFKYLLSSGSETVPAFAIKSSVRLPTGGSSYGGDEVDLSLQLLVSKSFEPFYAYAGGGYLFLFEDRPNNVPYRDHNYHTFVGFEYEWFENTSLLLAANFLSHPLENVDFQLSYQAYLDIGGVIDLTDSTALELLIRENMVSDDSSVDVSFIFGLRNRFKP